MDATDRFYSEPEPEEGWKKFYEKELETIREYALHRMPGEPLAGPGCPEGIVQSISEDGKTAEVLMSDGTIQTANLV